MVELIEFCENVADQTNYYMYTVPG